MYHVCDNCERRWPINVCYLSANIIALGCKITFVLDVQPATGVLGANRKSTVYKLIQPGLLFPRGYLWQVEKVRWDYLNRISD